MDISHILIKITSTPETVADLEAKLEDLRTKLASMNAKGSLKQVAEANNMTYTKTPFFSQWNFTPLSGNEYISGLHSFAFGNSDQVFSEVLQSNEGVYIFDKLINYPKGRHFEPNKEKILEAYIKKMKVDMAVKELEKVKSSLVAATKDGTATFGKAKIDSVEFSSFETWVPGIGYDALALHQIAHQKPNEWGDVYTTPYGAVIGKILSPADTNSSELELSKVLKEYTAYPKAASQSELAPIHQKWYDISEKLAEIVNKLDLVYRN